jgi:hypothetical protein
VAKSTDGGATWDVANAGLLTASRVYVLAIDPVTPSTLYAATDIGIYKSTDGGENWSEFNTGLPQRDIRALVIDPLTPSRLYAGTDRGGVFAIEQAPTCTGDCDGNGRVAINELVLGVNIVLDVKSLNACLAFANSEGMVDVAQLTHLRQRCTYDPSREGGRTGSIPQSNLLPYPLIFIKPGRPQRIAPSWEHLLSGGFILASFALSCGGRRSAMSSGKELGALSRCRALGSDGVSPRTGYCGGEQGERYYGAAAEGGG